MGIRRRLLRQKMQHEAESNSEMHEESFIIRKGINALEKQINATPKIMHPSLATQFFGGCRAGWQRRIDRKIKKGEPPTVEYLMEDFDSYPRFLEVVQMMKNQDGTPILTRDMFRKMAEELIADNADKIEAMNGA